MIKEVLRKVRKTKESDIKRHDQRQREKEGQR